MQKLVKGTILNPISDRKCDVFRDGALLCKTSAENLIIDKILTADELKALDESHCEVIDFGESLVIPGLIDLHFHWVQDDVRERPKDDLLIWLENYTWPAEEAYKNEQFCFNKSKEFSKKLLENGTIAGLCYGSIHDHSVEMALNHFVGDFYVGNVLMTMNSPEYLLQSEEVACQSMERLGKIYAEKYVITPRFAPTTDELTMSFGAKISQNYNCFIQSHLCETQNEIDWVLSIYRKRKGFEDVKSYSDIYDRCGLLGERTVMGHGVHLSDHDIDLLKKTKTAIAHCPTSNAPVEQKGLGSGLFDFSKADEVGIEWGLGSDIGAGPFLCMLDVMDSFVRQNSENPKATYVKSLYRATLKNAQIMKLDHMIGSFEKGKELGMTVLDHHTSSDNAEDIFTEFFKINDRALLSQKVLATYVHGKCHFRRDVG